MIAMIMKFGLWGIGIMNELYKTSQNDSVQFFQVSLRVEFPVLFKVAL